jgi:hypothetical protein
MVRAAALILALLATGAALAQTQKAILIFGGDDHDVFLGCLNCAETDSTSVANEYSKYGWGNDYGLWGTYGAYAGEYSSKSACSAYASHPPVLVDRDGGFYGYLTINEYKAQSVCGARGSEGICTALTKMCESK